MYKIYYLTSELDNNQPMYIGMTRLSLDRRLKCHKTDVKRHNKKCNWIRARDKKITIHLIEDNIETYQKCALKELEYIKTLDIENPNNKNSLKIIIVERVFKKSLKEIGESISKAIRKGAIKCKPIVALNRNNSFVNEYPTIISASKDLKVKEEGIIKILKDKSKGRKFIFVYKSEYDKNVDYSYKAYFPGIYKRKEKPIVSQNYRNKIAKKCKIFNSNTNETLEFDTQQKACDYIGISNSLISRCKKDGKLIKSIYKVV